MEETVMKYATSLKKFVGTKIDDEGIVEEVTNDTLLSAIKAWPTFSHNCTEFSFICSIAKHKIIDYYRKKKLKTILFSASPVFEEIADEALSPERDVLKNELKEEIEGTLKELKEGYGKILRLKYVEGWKINKIAETMKLSIKAVESRLIRAKRQFQQIWNYDNKKAKETVEANNTNRN